MGDWLTERAEDEQADLNRRKRFDLLGGEVLERSNQGLPEHWICGKEQGYLVDPLEVEDSQAVIHFIATLEQTKIHDGKSPEWHGALVNHPAVSDKNDWLMPSLIDHAEIARIEAEINRRFGN